MSKKTSWSLKQIIVASALTVFVLGGIISYAYMLNEYRQSVSQLKGVEQQYEEYQARQERAQKYQAQYEQARNK